MKAFKTIIFLITLLPLVHIAHAQKVTPSSRVGKNSAGLGLGLSYGGIGIRAGVNIADHLNLNAGVGYMLLGVGYNFGIRKEFSAGYSNTQLYLMGMYGSNAAIQVEGYSFGSGLSDANKLYNGISLGLGIKIHTGRNSSKYFDIGLLVPFRSSEYKSNVEKIKNDPLTTDFKPAWPVSPVFGFNF